MDLTQESNLERVREALSTRVADLQQQLLLLQSGSVSPTPSISPNPTESSGQPEPSTDFPERYAGEPKLCENFINQCSLHLDMHHRTFKTEESKVAFVLLLLTGPAATWGTEVWERRDPCCASFKALTGEMIRVFSKTKVNSSRRSGRRPRPSNFLRGGSAHRSL